MAAVGIRIGSVDEGSPARELAGVARRLRSGRAGIAGGPARPHARWPTREGAAGMRALAAMAAVGIELGSTVEGNLSKHAFKSSVAESHEMHRGAEIPAVTGAI